MHLLNCHHPPAIASPPPQTMAATHATVSLLLLFPLVLQTAALNLASRCLSSFNPGECPCSRRQSPSLDFCLTSATETTCRQRTCSHHYVCDCSGNTLCRSAPIRSTLSCRSPVLADGTCKCERSPIRIVTLATQLVPLRQHRPLQPVRTVMPRNRPFCTERPLFWAGYAAETLLKKHWRVAAERHRDAQIASVPLVRFGHAGHAISFTSPEAITRAMANVQPISSVDGDILDPVNHASVNDMTAECVAALLSIKLATHGIATRNNVAVDPFDLSNRLVLQPCAYLPNSNAAVGMSLERFMERAMLATGRFPIDDATVTHVDVSQACSAINRNFEACQVDIGCLAVIA